MFNRYRSWPIWLKYRPGRNRMSTFSQRSSRMSYRALPCSGRSAIIPRTTRRNTDAMHWWKWVARVALLLAIFSSLVACGSGQSFFGSTPTVYDLTQRPAEFANKDVTVQGYYLWKPGDPAISLLLPGLSTADGVRDAQ